MNTKIDTTKKELTINIFPALSTVTLNAIKNELKDKIDAKKDINICLKDTEYLDSSGIGFLMMLFKQHTKTGKKFYLTEVPSNIESILKLTSLYDILVRTNPDE